MQKTRERDEYEWDVAFKSELNLARRASKSSAVPLDSLARLDDYTFRMSIVHILLQSSKSRSVFLFIILRSRKAQWRHDARCSPLLHKCKGVAKVAMRADETLIRGAPLCLHLSSFSLI